MPSGWMPEIDVFAQWQLEQQQPFAIGRLEQQHPAWQQQAIALTPNSPPVSMIGMKRGRLSDPEQVLFGKRHRSSIDSDEMTPTDRSQSFFETSDPNANMRIQAVDNRQHTTPMIEAERQYKNGYVEYFSNSAQNVNTEMEHHTPTDYDMETVEHVEGLHQQNQQSQSISPNTCELYVTEGCYSPRQVQSYCRPNFGRSGDACALFPYRSDFY